MNDAPEVAAGAGEPWSKLTERLIQRHEAIRTNLRETTKWIMAGFAAVLTFAIGGSSLSQLGEMDPDWRFWLAVATLAVGSLFCLAPIWLAIDVIATRARGLDEIINTPAMEPARRQVEQQFLGQNGPDLDTFEKIKTKYEEAKNALPAGQDRCDELFYRMSEAVEFCTTAYTRLRFDTLLSSLAGVGAGAAICFGAFAWAAHPGKDKELEKIRAKPFAQLIAWSEDNEAVLKQAGMTSECMKAAHPTLIIVSERPGLRAGAVAVPASTAKGCVPVRVILTNENKLAAAD
jgi:hypothetical protein